MKDSVVAISEALRLARLELECYRDPDCRASADWTIRRLDSLLTNHVVTEALAVLMPDMESPPLIPKDEFVRSR